MKLIYEPKGKSKEYIDARPLDELSDMITAIEIVAAY